MRSRVLVVDDDAPFRAVACRLLRLGGFSVVGEAGSGAAAVTESRRLKPDVVLLDVQLPDIDGFEVAGELARQVPPPIVVLTSSRDGAAYRQRLSSSPARGFLDKAELSSAALQKMIS